MIKTMVVAGVLSLTIAAAHSAHARDSTQEGSARQVDAGAVDALIRRELVRERLSNQLPPIASREALAAFLRVSTAQHPLQRLSPSAKQRFLESLTFNENGVTGYRYDELLAELSASEIYRTLSLLGAQHTAPFLGKAKVLDDLDRVTVQSFGFGGDMCDSNGPAFGGTTCSDDIEDAKCVGPGTCERFHVGFVCRSTC